MNTALRSLSAVLLLLVALTAHAVETTPPCPIVDTTSTLTENQLSRLASTLAWLKGEKGIQLCILLVANSGGEDIRTHAELALGQMHPRRSAADKSVFLLITQDGPDLYFATSPALESTFPTARLESVRQTVLGHLREGDLDGGLQVAITELSRLQDNQLPATPAEATDASDSGMPVFKTFFLALILLPLFGKLLLRSRRTNLLHLFAYSLLVGLLALLVSLTVYRDLEQALMQAFLSTFFSFAIYLLIYLSLPSRKRRQNDIYVDIGVTDWSGESGQGPSLKSEQRVDDGDFTGGGGASGGAGASGDFGGSDGGD